MFITLCARSKMLRLLEPGFSFRIQADVLPEAGHHINLFPDSEARQNDCIINHSPRVVADYQTLTLMTDQVIDFSYTTQEFIITTSARE
jgi:hypothetical protein